MKFDGDLCGRKNHWLCVHFDWLLLGLFIWILLNLIILLFDWFRHLLTLKFDFPRLVRHGSIWIFSFDKVVESSHDFEGFGINHELGRFLANSLLHGWLEGVACVEVSVEYHGIGVSSSTVSLT